MSRYFVLLRGPVGTFGGSGEAGLAGTSGRKVRAMWRGEALWRRTYPDCEARRACARAQASGAACRDHGTAPA